MYCGQRAMVESDAAVSARTDGVRAGRRRLERTAGFEELSRRHARSRIGRPVRRAGMGLLMSGRRKLMGALDEVRRKGAAWLMRHLNADGSLGDPTEGFHIYRAPWTFSIVGEPGAAAGICDWIRREMLTAEGRIEGPYRVFDDAYAYRNATLIVGAHLARQYDLSYGLMPDLLSWQDSASGGFRNDRMADGGMNDRMDIPYACGPGLACLATGRLDIAGCVYRFLQRMYSAQMELPERFYYAWSCKDGGVITDFTDDEAFRHVVYNPVDRPQRWTVGGIAAGFLCRLYLAEPRPEYLALARRYQAFSMAATNAQFKYAQVCKSSWGASLLYQLTGERAYLDWACRMGDWYIQTQQREGCWHWTGYETLGSRIELTLEFVMHTDTLIGGLASRM